MFKEGDIVRSIEYYSVYCHEYNDKLDKFSIDKDKFEEGIIYDLTSVEFKVIGTIICDEENLVLVEDIVIGNYFLINEKKLIHNNECKEYNIPDFLNSDIRKILIKDRTTIVKLKDGTIGSCICNYKKDMFDEDKGIAIAYLRARANKIGNR